MAGNVRRTSRSHRRAAGRPGVTLARRSSTNASPVSISGAGATLNLVRARSSAVKFTLTTIHLRSLAPVSLRHPIQAQAILRP